MDSVEPLVTQTGRAIINDRPIVPTDIEACDDPLITARAHVDDNDELTTSSSGASAPSWDSAEFARARRSILGYLARAVPSLRDDGEGEPEAWELKAAADAASAASLGGAAALLRLPPLEGAPDAPVISPLGGAQTPTLTLMDPVEASAAAAGAAAEDGAAASTPGSSPLAGLGLSPGAAAGLHAKMQRAVHMAAAQASFTMDSGNSVVSVQPLTSMASVVTAAMNKSAATRAMAQSMETAKKVIQYPVNSLLLRNQEWTDRRRLEAITKFRAIDKDCSGNLDCEEVVASAGILNLSVEEAEGWFRELDPEGTGVVEMDAFLKKYMTATGFAEVSMALLKRADSGMRLVSRASSDAASMFASEQWRTYTVTKKMEATMEKFKSIDTDGSGSLTLEEIRAGATILGLKPEQAEKWFLEIDKDMSGHITPDEFLEKFKESSLFKSIMKSSMDMLASIGVKATHIMTNETISANLKATWHAAEELGNGVLAAAFKDTSIGALPLRLLRGHTVYSQNWKSDLWLHLKNKQIFLSLFCVHPDHPFSRSERISALTVSCVIAWGMEFWFCILWTSCDDHPELNFIELFIHVLLLKIGISAVANGIYDAILEQALTCACVQEGCPAPVKNGCELLSFMALLVQAGGGCLVIFLGATALIGGLHDGFGVQGRAEGLEDPAFYGFVAITIRELMIGKFVGLFVVTVIIECLSFFGKRKAQMKPPPEDLAARSLWDKKSISIFGVEGPAPSELWNRFIGAEVEAADLPDFAPTYDLDVRIFCRVVYRERASTPHKIPKWFFDEGFVDDGAEATLLALDTQEATGKAVKRGAKTQRRQSMAHIVSSFDLGDSGIELGAAGVGKSARRQSIAALIKAIGSFDGARAAGSDRSATLDVGGAGEAPNATLFSGPKVSKAKSADDANMLDSPHPRDISAPGLFIPGPDVKMQPAAVPRSASPSSPSVLFPGPGVKVKTSSTGPPSFSPGGIKVVPVGMETSNSEHVVSPFGSCSPAEVEARDVIGEKEQSRDPGSVGSGAAENARVQVKDIMV